MTLKYAIKHAIQSVNKSFRIAIDDRLLLSLGHDSKNWGDALNCVMIYRITGKKPTVVTVHTYNMVKRPVYSVIGSVLEKANTINCGNGNLTVWGTGFISAQGRLKVHPKEVRAVRGPLTRQILMRQGYICPEVYGDPALLYPRFYKPDVQRKYRLGIIPHYVDKDYPFMDNLIDDGILIIDIKAGVHHVIDRICSCERIASSSLHGIIAADAYGVPSLWMKLSEDVTGGAFKFNDYFSSVGRTNEVPMVIGSKTSIDDIIDNFNNYEIDIDLDELWDACPLPTQV